MPSMTSIRLARARAAHDRCAGGHGLQGDDAGNGLWKLGITATVARWSRCLSSVVGDEAGEVADVELHPGRLRLLAGRPGRSPGRR